MNSDVRVGFLWPRLMMNISTLLYRAQTECKAKYHLANLAWRGADLVAGKPSNCLAAMVAYTAGAYFLQIT
jgi:hypothetical protein